MAAYVPTFTQVKAPELDSRGMYYANSMFSQGLNSVVDLFKDEAAKQKTENTYEAIGKLRQAAQEGVTRNEQVQAAYSDPSLSTFDAQDAANLRASQASTAPNQLSQLLNQYTEGRGDKPVDLALLNQQYGNIENQMQGRFDKREEISMKLHDAATRDSQWNQEHIADVADKANAQRIREAELKIRQADSARQASEAKQRAADALEARTQRNALFHAGVINNSISATGDLVARQAVTGQNFQDTAKWDREIDAADASNKSAFTSGGTAATTTVPNLSRVDIEIPATTIQQAIANPDKIRDIATNLGLNVNDLQTVVNASKDKAGQAKAGYVQQTLSSIQDPLTKALVANEQLPKTVYTPATPLDAGTVANNAKSQSEDIKSTTLAKVEAIAPGASQVVGFKYSKNTNTMTPVVDDEALKAVYNITDTNTPEAKALKAQIESAANTVLADPKTQSAFVSTSTADTASAFARKISEDAAAKNAALNAENVAAANKIKAQKIQAATPEVMDRVTAGLNTDDTAKGLATALKTTAEAFRNVPGLSSVANEHFMRTLTDKAVAKGLTKDYWFADNTSSDFVRDALLPTLVEQNVITQLEASSLKEYVKKNPFNDKRDLKSGGGSASDDELKALLQAIAKIKSGATNTVPAGQATVNKAGSNATWFGSKQAQ
jgi:hypothetical protein